MKIIIYASVVCLLFSCKLKDAFFSYAKEPIDKLDSSEKMIEFVSINAGIKFDTIFKPISTILINDCEAKHRNEFYGTKFYISSLNMKSILNNFYNTKNANLKFSKEYDSETYKSYYITNSNQDDSLCLELDINTNQVNIHK
ncbi:MAG TPA: hypothetical protein PK431_07740 [Chitinophagales bacterium]|nr:hypothetical protein [Chitinophagales bacterium]